MSKNLARLVSISLIGGVIGLVLRYSINILIARGLGAASLGLFAFGLTVMKASGVFAQLGLDRTVQKFIPIYQKQGKVDAVHGTIILSLTIPFLLGTLFAVGFFLFQNTLVTLIGADFGSSIQLFIIGIPLFAVMMVGAAATRGFRETRYSVLIRDVGQSGMAAMFIAIGVYVFGDFRLVVLGYLTSLGVGVFLAVFFLQQQGDFQWGTGISVNAPRLLSFTLPITVAAISLYFLSWTDILMLGIFETAENVGWYQAAFQTSMLLTFVLHATNSVFPSIASDLYNRGERDELDRIYSTATKWIAYITTLGFVGLLIFASEVLSIFGIAAEPAIISLLILSVGQVVAAMTGPVGFVLTMSGYERLQMANAGFVSITNIGLNYLMIQQFGIVGAAIATGVSLGGINVIRLIETWILMGIQPYSKSYFKGALAIGPTIPVLLYVKGLPYPGLLRLVVAGPLALLLFSSIILVFGFDENDRSLFDAIR